jgi:hypothetical protein
VSWPERPASRRHVYWVAATIGIIAYLLVYGPSHLIGAGTYWDMPSKDERVYLIGYRYFLHEPWHWPLFASHRVDVPFVKSVAFLDCIPLWAFINKVIATVVPPWKAFSAQAYLGMWHGLTYALQPCLGVACMRALGHRSWREALVGALFFVAIPAWIFRYGHAALSAHSVVLWAFYLYIRTPADAPHPRRLGIAKLIQLACSALITPYICVMSFAVFAASLLRARRIRSTLPWFAGGLAAVAVVGWLCGYFDHETVTKQWGFDRESANVLSWLVPVRSGIIGDGRWIANVLGTEWQWEGYAYLGIGFIALLALALTQPRALRDAIYRHRYFVAIALLCGVLSLSNRIYFGSHEIITYRFPHVLHRIREQFRSPGRFTWIPMYAVMLYVLHRGFPRLTAGRAFAALYLLAAHQVVDARGEWALQRTWAHQTWSHYVDRELWRDLIAAHDSVREEPVSNCLHRDEGYDAELVATEIQLLVSEHALPINGTYTARPTRSCLVDGEEWPGLEPQPGTLYVLFPPATALAERFAARGASCAEFGQGRVCSMEHAAIAAALASGRMQPVQPPQRP